MSILFSHIQKTGGWQFYPEIIRRYGRNRVLLVGSRCTGGDIEGKELRKLSSNDLDDIDAVVGHYTISQAYSCKALHVWVAKKNPFIFSIVRHPLERIESLYRFRDKLEGHPQNGENSTETMDSFARKIPNDVQCKWLCYRRDGEILKYVGSEMLTPSLFTTKQIDSKLLKLLLHKGVIASAPKKVDKERTRSGRENYTDTFSFEVKLKFETSLDMDLYNSINARNN